MTIATGDDIRLLRERLAVVEARLEILDRRGSSNLEELAIMVARGRGILIAVSVMFGAFASAVLTWALRNN